VTIKDAGNQPGGIMRYGIPKYRLPRDILDAEKCPCGAISMVPEET
jgi:NADPH-dependent glutamate synthase beta subunit-like oxidoreductase